MDELDVKIINDYTSSDGLRKVVASTSQVVCSSFPDQLARVLKKLI